MGVEKRGTSPLRSYPSSGGNPTPMYILAALGGLHGFKNIKQEVGSDKLWGNMGKNWRGKNGARFDQNT